MIECSVRYNSNIGILDGGTYVPFTREVFLKEPESNLKLMCLGAGGASLALIASFVGLSLFGFSSGETPPPVAVQVTITPPETVDPSLGLDDPADRLALVEHDMDGIASAKPVELPNDHNNNPNYEAPPAWAQDCVAGLKGEQLYVPTICGRGNGLILIEPRKLFRQSAIGGYYEREARRGWAGHPPGERKPRKTPPRRPDSLPLEEGEPGV